MTITIASWCRRLTAASIRHPMTTIGAALVLVATMAIQAGGLTKEVGYASYFGPEDSRILRLSDYLAEFQSGVHLLVAFDCRNTESCDGVESASTLELIGRIQVRIDAIPHVQRSWSVLNTPIVDGPLATRTIGEPGPDGRWRLASDWPDLLALARQQKFVTSSMISPDGDTVGIVVELQSIQSEPMRTAVRELLSIQPEFEQWVGGPVYMAGDPIWTVYSADSLDRDSNLLTGLMFVAMLGLLGLIFRDASLSILPVASVGALFVVMQGLTATLGIPLTSVLAALPPLVVVIAMTSSIHFVSAALHALDRELAFPLEVAAESIGPGLTVFRESGHPLSYAAQALVA